MPGLTAEAPARAVGRYQLDTEVGRLTPAERAARGKAARAQVPRDSHAVFDPPADRFVGGSKHANQGQRVVAGQRITAEHGL